MDSSQQRDEDRVNSVLHRTVMLSDALQRSVAELVEVLATVGIAAEDPDD